MAKVIEYMYRLKFGLNALRLLMLWCLLTCGLADVYRGALSYNMTVYPLDRIYVNLIFYLGIFWIILALIDSAIISFNLSLKYFRVVRIYRCFVVAVVPLYIVCKLVWFHIPFYFSDMLVVGGVVILGYGINKIEYWISEDEQAN